MFVLIINLYWSNQVVFISFTEGTCVRCPSGKEELQIRRLSLPGHFGPTDQELKDIDYIKHLQQHVFW